MVFGLKPTIGKVQNYIRAKWGLGSAVQVSQMKAGVFMFRFDAEEDLDRILEKGPWTFDDRPLVHQPWSPTEKYSLESVKSLPVWVRFPGLAPHLLRPDILSIITSSVGRPIRTDGVTAQREKLWFARVLVEVFATHEFKKVVEIEGPDGIILEQDIEYEWSPPRCSICQTFGHVQSRCKLAKVQTVNEEHIEEREVVNLDVEEEINIMEKVGKGGEKKQVQQEKSVIGNSKGGNNRNENKLEKEGKGNGGNESNAGGGKEGRKENNVQQKEESRSKEKNQGTNEIKRTDKELEKKELKETENDLKDLEKDELSSDSVDLWNQEKEGKERPFIEFRSKAQKKKQKKKNKTSSQESDVNMSLAKLKQLVKEKNKGKKVSEGLVSKYLL